LKKVLSGLAQFSHAVVYLHQQTAKEPLNPFLMTPPIAQIIESPSHDTKWVFYCPLYTDGVEVMTIAEFIAKCERLGWKVPRLRASLHRDENAWYLRAPYRVIGTEVSNFYPVEEV